MARDLRVYDVFVASPGDVLEERDRLEEVIRELNDTWQDRLAIQLRLFRWENNAYPGFGEDAQDVINKELPETFDVFVGILWSRLGTPTSRGESGTVEEFERAYGQWKADNASIKLLIYFKKEQVDLDAIDLGQLAKVREFEASLPGKGGLTWRFSSADEFEQLARKHLAAVTQDLSKTPLAAPASPQEEKPEDLLEDEEEGLFDLVDRFQDAMAAVTTITGKFIGALSDMNASIQQGGAQINELDVARHPERARDAQRLINSMATKMELFASVLLPEIPVLDDAFGAAVVSLDKATEIAPDFGDSGVQSMCQNRGSIVDFVDVISGTKDTMETMQETVRKIPRVTTRFNKAKRRVVDALGKLNKSLDSASTQLQSSLDLLDRLCEGLEAAD